MRKRQMRFSFGEEKEFEVLWASIPSASQTEVARLYARLLVKLAKVATGTAQQRGERDDEK